MTSAAAPWSGDAHARCTAAAACRGGRVLSGHVVLSGHAAGEAVGRMGRQ